MMNTLLYLYFKLPHDRSFGIISKITNRLAARILKRILDRKVPNYFLRTLDKFPSGVNQLPRENKLIVSFTSFPGRIADVWIVVECLFRQTYKADKIILWLDQEKFDIDTLPPLLKAQTKRGLEIRLVEDLRSHTKYYYALKEFTNSYVITVDDDCYYPETLIENLMEINKAYPNSIASNRIHKLVFKDNLIVPYQKWSHNYSPKNTVNGDYLLTGVSGVLYAPSIFDAYFFDTSVFMEKCMFADDMWLTINAFRMNIPIASNSTFNKDMIAISKSGAVRLLNYNSRGSGNDVQLRAVLDHFNMGNLENFKKE
ncbi:glycosyltransferase family A protein [Flavobacterium sp.]|uniref:glycosyltransferase family A protein n=1 Tax=Flavobacterium sp. TaxID=239 RepID=UPI003F69AD04